MTPPRLILASKSNARRRLLANACVNFEVCAAQIDEGVLKSHCRKEKNTVEATALTLARRKASTISTKFPESVVISADQILEQNNVWFDKPNNMQMARAQLKALSGEKHRLITACCVYVSGTEKWHDLSIAQMLVRNLSDTTIDHYLNTVGSSALKSVGVYQLEGAGINLFNSIEGDYFSVLGLPLLPLLVFLRQFPHLSKI